MGGTWRHGPRRNHLFTVSKPHELRTFRMRTEFRAARSSVFVQSVCLVVSSLARSCTGSGVLGNVHLVALVGVPWGSKWLTESRSKQHSTAKPLTAQASHASATLSVDRMDYVLARGLGPKVVAPPTQSCRLFAIYRNIAYFKVYDAFVCGGSRVPCLFVHQESTGEKQSPQGRETPKNTHIPRNARNGSCPSAAEAQFHQVRLRQTLGGVPASASNG